VENTSTFVWRFLSRGGHITECWVRFAPRGMEVEIRSDGSQMAVRRFTTGTEATAWAEDLHETFRGDSRTE